MMLVLLPSELCYHTSIPLLFPKSKFESLNNIPQGHKNNFRKILFHFPWFHIHRYRWLLFRKFDSFFWSPNLQKKLFQKTILSLKFKFSRQLQYTVIGGKFKFQAQDSFLEYFFLRFGDLKKFHRTFWKKATFSSTYSEISNKSTKLCMYYLARFVESLWNRY